jgi:hypothetical protein
MYTCLEVFTATELDKAFSRQTIYKLQCFGDQLQLYHQEVKLVSETLDYDAVVCTKKLCCSYVKDHWPGKVGTVERNSIISELMSTFFHKELIHLKKRGIFSAFQNTFEKFRAIPEFLCTHSTISHGTPKRVLRDPRDPRNPDCEILAYHSTIKDQ